MYDYIFSGGIIRKPPICQRIGRDLEMERIVKMIPLTHCYNWTNQSREESRKRMREFREAGAKHLVLTSGLLGEGLRSMRYLLDFRSDMREFGLDFVDAHALWGNWEDPGMPLEEWHEIVILRHKASIRLCAAFGVRTLAFHTGNTFNSIFGSSLTLEDYKRMLIRSLEELLVYAERNGVILCLENQWTPLNQSRILLEMMEYFNSKNLGLCYDSGHGNLTEKGSACLERSCVPAIWEDLGIPVQWEENLIEKFSPWLVNCHLHDNHGFGDEHNLPGDGNIDWKRILEVLKHSPRLECIQNEASFRDYPIDRVCRQFSSLLESFA